MFITLIYELRNFSKFAQLVKRQSTNTKPYAVHQNTLPPRKESESIFKKL